MAKWFDIRGRIAEANARRFEDFYERSVGRIYAENRNAIATFRDQAIEEVAAMEGGNPHAWAVAESHQSEMLWRNRQSFKDISYGTNGSGQFTDDERVSAVKRSRLHYKNDPLYTRAINLTTAFIYGGGVTTPKPSRDVPDSDKDAVAQIVNTFWHDDFNLRFLTGNSAQVEVCRRFLRDGEVPVMLTLDTYRAVPVDALDIVGVMEHSGLTGVPMCYKRQEGPNKWRYYWSAEAEIYKADPSFAAERERIAAGLHGDEIPPEDRVLILWAYGGGLRGYPPFFAALDWGAANTLLAGNLQSYVKSVTAIVAKYKGKMTAADITRVKNAIGSNLSQTAGLPPPTGSARIEGEGGPEYSLLNVPTGGAELFKAGFEVSRLMVAAATGCPVHWLGDPSTGNLATATAMELAQVKDFEGWQQWWIGCYDNLFRTIARLNDIRTDTSRFIEIDFPALTQDDFAATAQGLSVLYASGGMSEADMARQVAYLCQTDDVEGWVNRAMTQDDSLEAEMVKLAESQPMRFVAMFRSTADKVAAKHKETVSGNHSR